MLTVIQDLVWIVEIERFNIGADISVVSVELRCNLHFQIYVSWAFTYRLANPMFIYLFTFLKFRWIIDDRYLDDSLLALDDSFFRFFL